MITVRQIDTGSRRERQQFVQFPFDLYGRHPTWVPPIRLDVETLLNREKHPFYEHSEAAFFLAERDGELAGRIATLENRPYNRYHDLAQAQFYLFECVEDFEVAQALFERAFEWARARNLNQIVGPKGFGPLDGYGMLVDGFEFRPAMTMMNYNPPYYPAFAERLGFRKVVDFISHYISGEGFQLNERVRRIAERAAKRSGLVVRRFKTKRELRAWAPRVGRTYNDSFVNNWEYYPLTDNEIRFLTDNLMLVADPKLMKLITHGEDVVGFLFAFADVSAALQRIRGRLLPFGIIDLLLEARRTDWVSVNGVGILPEFQGRGGNAIMYAEMEKTLREAGFRHADLTQVAETAVEMRSDLETVGGVPYKNHRVYVRDL